MPTLTNINTLSPTLSQTNFSQILSEISNNSNSPHYIHPQTLITLFTQIHQLQITLNNIHKII